MKHLALLLSLLAVRLTAVSDVVPGHHLPSGDPRPVRLPEVDATALVADLRVDLQKEEVSGTVSITFTPLAPDLARLPLDAAGLEVSKATVDGKDAPFETIDRLLFITLPSSAEANAAGPSAAATAGASRTVSITYTVKPPCGLYFYPAAPGKAAQAWNYGEGGLHSGWIPLYSGTNDKLTVDMSVTVAKPSVAVCNGRLASTRENADGTRTFRWVEEKPIPNYLLALNVGDFRKVDLAHASVGGRQVPLAVWTPPGTEEAARHAFGETPRMMEYFSKRFGVPYPWLKYDQVVLREFAVGAMETNSAVGFREASLHVPGDPPDDVPLFEPWPTWGQGDTVAHELAHHWLGNLVTCRSLGHLWLNESFATFSHVLWTGEARGEDDMTYQRFRYLRSYLDYVRRTGEVRPLEHLAYPAPGDMYQLETTYLKGAIVLHMLRHMLGDEPFYRGLAAYIQRHAYGNAESTDLKAALENASGRNLDAFFADWIVGGGGHPVFDLSWAYSPERAQVDLTIEQLQAELPFENDFRLSVDVEVVTATGARTHVVEIPGRTTRVSLPAPAKPVAVTFDKGGWLVAEVRQDRSLAELLHQLRKGGLAEALRAAQDLGEDQGAVAEATAALAAVLLDPRAHWGLRQVAATSLGSAGRDAATEALVKASQDPDRRVRRAVAFALGRSGGKGAADALRRLVEKDTAEDVVMLASDSLGRLRVPLAKDVLLAQLRRDSRWSDVIRLGAMSGLGHLEDARLAPTFERHLGVDQSQEVRQAALAAWRRAAPDDPRLAARLVELTDDRNRAVRADALAGLAALHRAADRELFETLAIDPDPNISAAAMDALETLSAFAPEPPG